MNIFSYITEASNSVERNIHIFADVGIDNCALHSKLGILDADD